MCLILYYDYLCCLVIEAIRRKRALTSYRLRLLSSCSVNIPKIHTAMVGNSKLEIVPLIIHTYLQSMMLLCFINLVRLILSGTGYLVYDELYPSFSKMAFKFICMGNFLPVHKINVPTYFIKL